METSHFAGASGSAGTDKGLIVDMDALIAAFAPCELGGSTVAEICEATGLGEARIRREIKSLLKDGKAKPMRKRISIMDGRQATVPSYALEVGQ